MIDKPKVTPERGKRRIVRHSTQKLLQRPVQLQGGLILSAEKHKGRLVVRVESPLAEFSHSGELD
jgi:hypothetical protein